MSDITEIVKDVLGGLSGQNWPIIFSLSVLAGGGFLFKSTFMSFSEKFINNVTEELKKTREVLISIQQNQLNFEHRLEKVENEIKRNKK